MRTAGMRVFAGIVLALALVISTVLPLAAVTGPALMATLPDSGVGKAPVVAVASADHRRQPITPAPVDPMQRLLDTAGADYSQLVGLGSAPESGATGAVDEPSLLSIPGVVLTAYRNAARSASSLVAGCSLDWPVLAGIGRVESRHGLFHGADTVIDTQGNIGQSIIGPPLDGNGVSAIPDSDQGRLDGDSQWDRAVGMMQFIPSSWRRFGQDGNADGSLDPHNVFDATLAAADHLCSTQPGDLSQDARLDRALFAYNRSDQYVTDVRRWIDIYRSADPAELTPTGVALETTPEGRRNPFSGQLSTVAFDDSPIGPRLPSSTTPSASSMQRTGPASERTHAPSVTPKSAPAPKASSPKTPKTAAKKSTATPKKSQTTAKKSQTTAKKSETTAKKSDTAQKKPSATPKKSETTAKKSESPPADNESEPADKRAASEAEPEPAEPAPAASAATEEVPATEATSTPAPAEEPATEAAPEAESAPEAEAGSDDETSEPEPTASASP